MRRKNKSFFKYSFADLMENKFHLFADDGADDAAGGGGADDAADDASGADDAADDKAAAAPASKDSLLSAADKKADIKTKADEVVLLAGKFKNAEELETGYKELTKKLTESGKIAPDKYELALPEGLALADADNDPLLKSFDEVAKKHNLTNAAFNDLIALKLKADLESAPNYEAEVEKLGPKGMETLKGLSSFLSANLSKEEYIIAERMCATAEGVKVLDKLRGLTVNSTVPGAMGGDNSGKPSKEAAEEKLAKANKALAAGLPEGPRLRKEAEAMFAEIYQD